jgi:hypothetical protein
MEETTTEEAPNPKRDASLTEAPALIPDRREDVIRKLDQAWILALQDLFAEPLAA